MLPLGGYVNYIFILGIVLVALIAIRLIFVGLKKRKENNRVD